MNTTETGHRADFVGAWKIVQSDARFLPVAGVLHVDDTLRGQVSWPDAAHPGFELFPGGELTAGRLTRTVSKPNPGKGGSLSCVFSMVLESVPEGRLLFGLVHVDDGRGDSSTGTFVAEETDTIDP